MRARWFAWMCVSSPRMHTARVVVAMQATYTLSLRMHCRTTRSDSRSIGEELTSYAGLMTGMESTWTVGHRVQARLLSWIFRSNWRAQRFNVETPARETIGPVFTPADGQITGTQNSRSGENSARKAFGLAATWRPPTIPKSDCCLPPYNMFSACNSRGNCTCILLSFSLDALQCWRHKASSRAHADAGDVRLVELRALSLRGRVRRTLIFGCKRVQASGV